MSVGVTTAGVGSLSQIISRSISIFSVSMGKCGIRHHVYKPKLMSTPQEVLRQVKQPLIQLATVQKIRHQARLYSGMVRVLRFLVSLVSVRG